MLGLMTNNTEVKTRQIIAQTQIVPFCMFICQIIAHSITATKARPLEHFFYYCQDKECVKRMISDFDSYDKF